MPICIQYQCYLLCNYHYVCNVLWNVFLSTTLLRCDKINLRQSPKTSWKNVSPFLFFLLFSVFANILSQVRYSQHRGNNNTHVCQVTGRYDAQWGNYRVPNLQMSFTQNNENGYGIG